jgi:hypothetical protein
MAMAAETARVMRFLQAAFCRQDSFYAGLERAKLEFDHGRISHSSPPRDGEDDPLLKTLLAETGSRHGTMI